MTTKTKTEAKTDTKTKAVKLGRGKAPRAVVENAAKENILHLRLERADHDALEALVLSTGLDRSALTRLVLRAGIRVAENDPRDLLVPKVGAMRPMGAVARSETAGTQGSVASRASGPRTVPAR